MIKKCHQTNGRIAYESKIGIRRKASLPAPVSNCWRCLEDKPLRDLYRFEKEAPDVSVGSDLKTAREELRVLQARNIRKEDFDKDKARGLTLFSWIDRFLHVKASKRSLTKDKVSAERIKTFFGDRPLDSILTSEIEAYKQKRLGEIDPI